MIIMDELDAICKQRGSTNTGTGVHDTVVNQLLSKIDGVEQLNNILIIGMTNRLVTGSNNQVLSLFQLEFCKHYFKYHLLIFS